MKKEPNPILEDLVMTAIVIIGLFIAMVVYEAVGPEINSWQDLFEVLL